MVAVLVPVMNVGEVAVAMGQRRVGVLVGVRIARRTLRPVGVLMMGVMAVRVRV